MRRAHRRAPPVLRGRGGVRALAGVAFNIACGMSCGVACGVASAVGALCRGGVVALTALIFGGACAPGNAVRPAVVDVVAPAPAPAEPLADVAPIAVQLVTAPGLDARDLTLRLRDALARTSGGVVVDPLSVRAELDACAADACVDTQRQRFEAARHVVAATVSRLSGGVVGSAQIVVGGRELARSSHEGADAASVVDHLGWDLGARFRAMVLASASSEPPAATSSTSSTSSTEDQ